MTAQTTTWPEGVVARYLTVGGATVDITYTPSEDLRARCQGARCQWTSGATTEVSYGDSDETIVQRIDAALPPLQWDAQAHAEMCRAMPRPAA